MMRKIKNNLILLLSICTLLSCSTEDKVIDEVFNNLENGAVLRTVGILSNTLNSSNPESSWSVEIEEQDSKNGGLLKSVDVYVSLTDLTPDNGTTTKPEILLKSVSADQFTTGDFGLPRTIISSTFGESEAAMGLSSNDYAPGDLFTYRLVLNLTDGRSFTNSNTAGTVSGGSFYSSPFAYSALIVCSPVPGVYRVEMHDSYGDGWQTSNGAGGAGITVNIDGTIVEIGMCSPYAASSFNCTTWPSGIDPESEFTDATTTVTIPDGTQTATWNFPGDTYGEISFEVYAPDGRLLLAVPTGSGSVGILPVTNCL